jgi:magnesium chelatase family protein
LRQPLEDKKVRITRSKAKAEFPANFTLLAAMNPCPCGNYGSEDDNCSCSPQARKRYQRKISGPIMDRIDMWIEVAEVDHEKLANQSDGEASETVRTRVQDARNTQHKRFTESDVTHNSDMSAKEIEDTIDLAKDVRQTLTQSANKLDLSARAHHKTVKLARTVADLDGAEHIQEPHLLEALQYRSRDSLG